MLISNSKSSQRANRILNSASLWARRWQLYSSTVLSKNMLFKFKLHFILVSSLIQKKLLIIKWTPSAFPLHKRENCLFVFSTASFSLRGGAEMDTLCQNNKALAQARLVKRKQNSSMACSGCNPIWSISSGHVLERQQWTLMHLHSLGFSPKHLWSS